MLAQKRRYKKSLVLIDAANIIYSNRYLNWSLDHQKLIKYLKERYDAQRVIYYAGLEKDDDEKAKFYQKIKKFGFETKIKPVVEFRGKIFWKKIRCPNCQKIFKQKFQGPPIKKANCDVILTLDTLIYHREYKTILLFSGDGDFSPLVTYLRKKGKSVLVFSSKQSCSRQLRRVANQFTEIDNLKSLLEAKK